MKKPADTTDIEALRKVVQEAVKEAIGEVFKEFPPNPTGASSIFPLRTARQVAMIFNVTHWTVRNWCKQGILSGRYQILSGRACRLVFTNRDLLRFFDENFPSPEDLGHPCSPRSSKAALVEKMFRMNRLYARRRQRTGEPQT